MEVGGLSWVIGVILQLLIEILKVHQVMDIPSLISNGLCAPQNRPPPAPSWKSMPSLPTSYLLRGFAVSFREGSSVLTMVEATNLWFHPSS